MKKTLFVLIASLVALSNVVYAGQIKTKLVAAPFQTLTLDKKVWSLEYSDKSAIGFVLIEDDDVEFDIFQGRLLKKATVDELAKQIRKANGNLSKVSLLKTSFPELKDAEDDEAKINNWVEIKMSGIDGIKFHMNTTVSEVEFTNDEENIISETIYPGVGCFFVTENRIYLISFSAPPEKFPNVEPIFEETLQHLFINIK